MAERMMVIAAHIGDFVWRCGGAIAKNIQEGNAVRLVVLSDGIRGECNNYFKQPGATLEAGKKQRLEEGKLAAARLGVTDFVFFDYSDYPLDLTAARIEQLAHCIREFRPDFIVTHDTWDAYNPDHDMTCDFAHKAYMCATGAGFQDGLKPVKRQVPFFGFEPHQTEACRFYPAQYVDITDVMDIKREAMKVYASQPSMYAHYVTKAELRASEVRYWSRRPDCKYAEAFATERPCTDSGNFTY